MILQMSHGSLILSKMNKKGDFAEVTETLTQQLRWKQLIGQLDNQMLTDCYALPTTVMHRGGLVEILQLVLVITKDSSKSLVFMQHL